MFRTVISHGLGLFYKRNICFFILWGTDFPLIDCLLYHLPRSNRIPPSSLSVSSTYFVLHFFSCCIVIPLQMVVLLAGVVGTPLGGLLADYCQTCHENVQDLHGYDDEEENEGDSVEQHELGDVVVVVDYESSTTSSSPASLLPSTDGYGREDIVSVDNITKSTNANDVYTNINRSHPNSAPAIARHELQCSEIILAYPKESRPPIRPSARLFKTVRKFYRSNQYQSNSLPEFLATPAWSLCRRRPPR